MGQFTQEQLTERHSQPEATRRNECPAHTLLPGHRISETRPKAGGHRGCHLPHGRRREEKSGRVEKKSKHTNTVVHYIEKSIFVD